MFFSSHILADAEALCSRVGNLAGGRLMASGALSDLLALAGAAAGSWWSTACRADALARAPAPTVAR